MMENWDVAPWVIATIAGPLVLAAAIAYGMMRHRRRSVADRRSPDYDDAG